MAVVQKTWAVQYLGLELGMTDHRTYFVIDQQVSAGWVVYKHSEQSVVGRHRQFVQRALAVHLEEGIDLEVVALD